uniref:RING-type domain-containing protein n=1 Tax=Elaeophora elaphi TaxID=1147741 RepID=A0A0R3RHN0_9BILA
MAVCSICLECKESNDMQKLPCSHMFCKDCLSKCSTSQLCPAPCCTHVRHVNVVIDEADQDDEETRKISFGQKLPSMLQLEERQRCDGKKGAFACVNSARMTLMDCRHHLCFDCLTSRINVAVAAHELPYCPIFRCANRLTKNEIAKISERAPHMRKICAKLIEASPEDAPEEPPGKDECVFFCSVYQSESSIKPIIFPLACTVLDMVSAMIQVQRLTKNRTANNIGVYIRTAIAGKPKYDPVDVRAMTKKKIGETDFHDRTHFVLDVDNELKTMNLVK